MATVSHVGIWPFSSEQSKNLDQAVTAAAALVKARVEPQLSVVERATWFVVDVYRNPWTQFIRDYMSIAKAVGKPYTSNVDFYSVWQPRLIGMGWGEEISEKLMAALRELNAQGKIPQEVMNPAHVKAAGSSGTPLESLGEAVEGTVVKVAAVGVVGFFVYRFVSKKFL